MLWKVNKNGEANWHTIEAASAQDAVEQKYDMLVYHYDTREHMMLFSTLDDLLLFAAHKVETSDLGKMVNFEEGTFTWGKMVCVHEIGDFQVVEYYPRMGKHTNEYRYGDVVEFHPFVNAQDMEMAFQTLDEALLAAIIFKRAGNKITARHVTGFILDFRRDKDG